MLPHLNNPRILFGVLLMAAVVAYALWRGGKPERWAAAAMAAAYVATVPASKLTGAFGPRYGIFAVDVSLLVVLIVLALVSDRKWPMWAAGFMLVEVVMHLTIILDRQVMSAAYVIALHMWSYAVMLALVVGVTGYWRRRRRGLDLPPGNEGMAPTP